MTKSKNILDKKKLTINNVYLHTVTTGHATCPKCGQELDIDDAHERMDATFKCSTCRLEFDIKLPYDDQNEDYDHVEVRFLGTDKCLMHDREGCFCINCRLKEEKQNTQNKYFTSRAKQYTFRGKEGTFRFTRDKVYSYAEVRLEVLDAIGSGVIDWYKDVYKHLVEVDKDGKEIDY